MTPEPFSQPLITQGLPVGPLALLAFTLPGDLKVNDYDPIAAVFDDVMAYDFHDATHHLRRRVALDLHNGAPLRCFDLCAGTGLFLSLLSRDLPISGWGVDLSPGQAALASARAKTDGGSCSYEVGNALTAVLPGDADLVTINFDALNHIHYSEKWKFLFEKVQRALRPGGALLIDVNLPDRLIRDWDAPEVIVKDSVTYIQLGLPHRQIGPGVIRQTPMIVFRQDEPGVFSRHVALIEQFALPLADVVQMLGACGFSTTEVLQPPASAPNGHVFNKNRAFVVARK